MANLAIKEKSQKGRTFISIAATPKSPKTRALLRQFRKGVRVLARKWKAAVRAANRAAKK